VSLTSALVVDARLVGRTVVVASAANVTRQSVADLAAPAIVVFAAQRFAHGNGQVALFVPVTRRVGRTHGLTRVVFARIPGRTFAILVARFGRRSDARYFGGGIGHESHPARAHGPLIRHRAHSVGPARHGQTGIGARVVPARFHRSAILVRLAAEQAHVVQTYMSQKAVVIYPARYWKIV